MVSVQGKPLFPHALYAVMVACCSIACYIAVDISICIFITFKRYTGLYFWSMQILSWSLLANNIANMTYFIALVIPRWGMGTFSVFSWSIMVSSQALVLYSRLHLIVLDPRQIRWVPWMIGISLTVLLIPRTVLYYVAGSGANIFLPSYIYHKIALFGLFLQELIICTIYIREAIRLLKPVSSVELHDTWTILVYLIVTNIIIILCSATILITEFIWFVPTEMSFHALMYGIKLKLEHFVLSQLCDAARGCHCLCHHTQLRSSNIHENFLLHEARLTTGNRLGQGTKSDQHDHELPSEQRDMSQ